MSVAERAKAPLYLPGLPQEDCARGWTPTTKTHPVPVTRTVSTSCQTVAYQGTTSVGPQQYSKYSRAIDDCIINVLL